MNATDMTLNPALGDLVAPTTSEALTKASTAHADVTTPIDKDLAA